MTGRTLSAAPISSCCWGTAIPGPTRRITSSIGGGIGPSMLSGYLVGRTIVEAFEKDDVNKKHLWPLNIRYNELYGAKQASLDIFRMLLLTSSDHDLNFGMNYQLLKEEDVLKAGLGDEFHLNITETAKRVFKGLKNLRFLNRLRLTVKMMKQVRVHYKTYPETPEDFEKWRRQTVHIFEDAKSKIALAA
jgi:flavin-dependent dehydrogenase